MKTIIKLLTFITLSLFAITYLCEALTVWKIVNIQALHDIVGLCVGYAGLVLVGIIAVIAFVRCVKSGYNNAKFMCNKDSWDI